MRILHADAILLNISYLQKKYSHHDQVLNRGGRTLISPAFMHFATTEPSMFKTSEHGISFQSNQTYNE
jgi:hypothetical protein